MDCISYQVLDSIATLTFSRPEALNALSLELTNDLIAAVRQASEDGARAVVLTGSGPGFCAGGDLREMREMLSEGGEVKTHMYAPLNAMHEAVRLIRTTPIPFVAAVNGICAGAGTNFALACDIVIAADNASFNEAFVKIGLSPDCGGTFFLPRVIGEKRAAELFMTGESVSAERAAQLGMINRVVSAGDLMDEALKMAQRLAQMPTGAIGRIKKMLNASASNTLEEQLGLEAECQIESGSSEDFREGVTAFFEKRPPKFTGR